MFEMRYETLDCNKPKRDVGGAASCIDMRRHAAAAAALKLQANPALTNTQIVAAFQKRALPDERSRDERGGRTFHLGEPGSHHRQGAPGALLALCIPSLGAIRSSHQTRALPRDDG
jgi:hypothetical protein